MLRNVLRGMWKRTSQGARDEVVERVAGNPTRREVLEDLTGSSMVDGLGLVSRQESVVVPLAPRGRNPDKYQQKVNN